MVSKTLHQAYSCPLFRSIRGRTASAAICVDAAYKVVAHWTKVAGIHFDGLGVHGLRASAATNTLKQDADIASMVGLRLNQHNTDVWSTWAAIGGFTYVQSEMLTEVFVMGLAAPFALERSNADGRVYQP